MSADNSSATPKVGQQMKATERIAPGPRGPGRGGPMGGPMVAEKAATFGPSAKRLLGRMAPQRLLLSAVVLFAVVGVVLQSLAPRFLGHATDRIFAGATGRKLPAGETVDQIVAGLRERGQDRLADVIAGMDYLVPGKGVDFGAVGHILLLVIGLYVVAQVFGLVQGLLLNRVVQAAMRELRGDVEEKLQVLPLEYFDSQPRGEILSRVTNDIENVSQTLGQTMSQLLTSVAQVVTILVMMFSISWLLALIALVSVPISMGVARMVMQRSQGQFKEQWRQTGQLSAHIEETFSGHDLVRVFGRQRDVEEVFAERNEGLFRAGFRAQFASGLVMPAMQFIGNLNFVAVAVVGGIRVAHGAMTVGDVQAFIQYSRQFNMPLTQVASMLNLLQSGVASAERVFELLDAPEQVPDRDGSLPAASSGARGEVRFEEVSFSYDPAHPLIQDLSLVAQPGQTVAIVGPTGAGKTTLVNLIMRFYELDGGRITLDGVDITSIPRGVLREQTGMVLQDTWLFAGTIRENLLYGRPDATTDELLEAARATFVDRFVHSLPDGYDTLVDADGGSLSAGERQLLTICRAFLAQPALLILDEATSSVDTRTELLLQQAMAALRTDRTSFVIAHRLSTIRDADLILVMEAGRIVEQGSHDELIAAGGAYARLYQSQFASAT
ncbi:MAG: ABC transporter ATP-binding protein [Nocardioides sp.]|uniref:ABC transporter ATP-binding protein n=1 Tax=Nocardioides sp. TaxID=35761 RepID=UPI0039E6C322